MIDDFKDNLRRKSLCVWSPLTWRNYRGLTRHIIFMVAIPVLTLMSTMPYTLLSAIDKFKTKTFLRH